MKLKLPMLILVTGITGGAAADQEPAVALREQIPVVHQGISKWE